MTNKESALAILNYQEYDRLPIVHFGFWRETLAKWAKEGHISVEETNDSFDSQPIHNRIAKKLGLPHFITAKEFYKAKKGRIELKK